VLLEEEATHKEKTMKRFFLPFLLILVLTTSISACAESPANPPASTDTSPQDGAPAAPEPGIPATAEPVIPVPGDPDDILSQPIPIPAAVLVDTRDGLGLTLYDRTGLALGEWAITPPVPGSGHVAASIADGVNAAPLVFLGGSDEPGATFLRTSLGGNTSVLFEVPQPPGSRLVGVPGQPFIAFSTIEPLSEGAIIRSKLYVGSYDVVSLDTPALVMDSNESRIIVPVAIRMGFEKPEGVWYTLSWWGIGGDLFTEPFAGLYYLDLETGGVSEFLGMDKTFSGLSVSQTLAAWTASPNAALSVTNLKTGDSVTFPVLPENDRGATHAFVSPGDGYVAWVEGMGWLYDGNLETTIRIVTLNGISLGDYPASLFAKSSGLGTDILICPVGWLNDEVLLVAVYSQATEEGSLVLLNANTGELSPYHEGFFAGFAYP
jgi:hypothetical protein